MSQPPKLNDPELGDIQAIVFVPDQPTKAEKAELTKIEADNKAAIDGIDPAANDALI